MPPTPAADPDYLTLTEAAASLGAISVSTLRRACRERGLPIFKIIGRRESLVRLADVEALRGATVRVQYWPVVEEA